MIVAGVVGIGAALTVGVVPLVGWASTQSVDVRGYTAIMLAVLFSFSTLLLALGIVGGYVWRISENTKGRPTYLVQLDRESRRRHSSAAVVPRAPLRRRQSIAAGATLADAPPSRAGASSCMTSANNDNFMHLTLAQQCWQATGRFGLLRQRLGA